MVRGVLATLGLRRWGTPKGTSMVAKRVWHLQQAPEAKDASGVLVVTLGPELPRQQGAWVPGVRTRRPGQSQRLCTGQAEVFGDRPHKSCTDPGGHLRDLIRVTSACLLGSDPPHRVTVPSPLQGQGTEWEEDPGLPWTNSKQEGLSMSVSSFSESLLWGRTPCRPPVTGETPRSSTHSSTFWSAVPFQLPLPPHLWTPSPGWPRLSQSCCSHRISQGAHLRTI